MARKSEPKERTISYTATRTIKLVEKNCPICGEPFIGPEFKIFCSIACRSKHHYRENSEQFRAARREKYRQQKATSAKTKKADA